MPFYFIDLAQYTCQLKYVYKWNTDLDQSIYLKKKLHVTCLIDLTSHADLAT